ncbi:LysR family transcriptional regulator [Luteibacter sp. 329MFSha]|uniref:LysR family transcriptional regulator n=1 Tax=Luteibacter sp. 329MFSha TaxID=1798239 RepID=UPI0008BEBFC0|nr:LysR family transcriptional regulator [Luteibacter sp. 329MFSha]SEV92403.1 DNA-binding transcriptional regulator, LysR family [Luteibacter sp. 329MFSha]
MRTKETENEYADAIHRCGICVFITAMDFHGVDLNLLVAFDALMSERSVTRAAKRVGRTQPAMSASLARLRTLFRDELFVRGREQLQPTQRAVDLAEPIGRALREIRRTLGDADRFDPLASAPSVNIGMQEHAAFRLLPGLLACLRKDCPAVRVNVVAYPARDDALTLLDSGEVDVAVGVPPASAPGRIFLQPLFEEAFVCVVRKGHPVSRRPLDLDTYLTLEHLLVSPEGDRFGHTDTELAKRGLSRRLSVTINQMYPAPAIIAGSDLIATLMRGVVDIGGWHDRLDLLEPPVELSPCPYVMCWHRRNDRHPAQRWLRSRLATLVPAEAPRPFAL